MKLRRISKALLAGILLWSGCSEENNTVDDQRTAFERYLNGQETKYSVQSGVYKFTPNTDREGYDENAPAIEYGDSVKFDFALLGFSNKPEGLIFTNMEALIEGDTVLNPQYWSFAPQGIKLGSTPLIKGLEYGMVGSRAGDSVVLLLTSDLSYGDKPTGVIPADTPVVWALKINSIVKKP